ncbi:hypothetical protein PtrSN002B_012171, partial [Pyrenophora tritici-repentis]
MSTPSRSGTVAPGKSTLSMRGASEYTAPNLHGVASVSTVAPAVGESPSVGRKRWNGHPPHVVLDSLVSQKMSANGGGFDIWGKEVFSSWAQSLGGGERVAFQGSTCPLPFLEAVED